MNKHHPLDEAFQRRLRDLEAETPMHLWEQISQKRDWKHRMLNQARQKMPLASLFAALVVVGLSWVIWSYQQPTLGHFPVPLSNAVAADTPVEQPSTTVLSSIVAKDITTPGTLAFGVVKASAKVAAAVDPAPLTGQAEQPAAAAVPAILEAQASPGLNPAAATSPAVRPIREEVPPTLPVATEESIFGRLFSPDPKCANFNKGSWSFYVDALLSPDITFRQLQPRNPEFEEYVNTREETESNMYAFSGALRLSLVSDKGWALRTGLNYSQINERFSYINGSEEVIETINNYDQDGNIISTDTIIKVGTRRKITQNHYRMLDIPFLLGYELSSNKLKVSINGGAYLNLLFRQKGDFLSPHDLQPVRFDSSDPDAYPAFKQQAGLGWYGSVGFAYQAGPNLQLVIEPHFKIFPKSVTRDQYGVQQRYMTTGLFLGVRQRL